MTTTTRPVMVVGAAQLEIVAQKAGRTGAVDTEESVGIEVGGRGARLAMRFADIGLEVRLLTAMNASIYSTLVTKHITEQGVTLHAEMDPALPTALASEHLDCNGRVLTKISKEIIGLVCFGEERIAAAMRDAGLIVCDAALNEDSLKTICRLASDSNIPVYATGITITNMHKLLTVSQWVAGIFVGHNDSTAVGDLGWDKVERSIGLDGTTHIGRHPDVLITLEGGDLATIINGDTNYFPVNSAMREALREQGARWQRAFPDAFAANYLYRHCYLDEPANQAVIGAMQAAADGVMEPWSRTNESGEAFENLVHGIANLDKMTSVLNRGGMEILLARLTNELRSGELHSLSVIMVDIDRFKDVNDTYGHETGDHVIVTVVNAIRDLLRGSDAVGRWGGEEFLVVLPNAHMDEAARVAERIRVSVEGLIDDPARELPRRITVSQGVAQMEFQEASEETIRRADVELYNAKHAGRNAVKVAV